MAAFFDLSTHDVVPTRQTYFAREKWHSCPSFTRLFRELIGIWALAAAYDQVNNRFATVSAMRTLRFFTGSRRLRTLSIPIRNEPDRLEGQDHAEHRGISDHRAGRQDHRI